MSFGSPLVLLVLLLVPVAIARYVRGERARRRRARAFANPTLLASIAPVRPGWRRHVPLAFYALALAILVVAAAR
ncbi:MAG TPA: BatA domain-containing protein, partial [Solirubrobacteraceae bacterium]